MMLQLRQCPVLLILFSCWTRLEASLKAISTWSSRFCRILSAAWISTAGRHVWVLSRILDTSERWLTWKPTRQLQDFSQPSLHYVTQEAQPTQLLRLPTFAARCWLDGQVTVVTHLTLSSFSLMDNQGTLQPLGSVFNLLNFFCHVCDSETSWPTNHGNVMVLFSMCHSIHVPVNTGLNCSFFTLIFAVLL